MSILLRQIGACVGRCRSSVPKGLAIIVLALAAWVLVLWSAYGTFVVVSILFG